MAKVKITRSDVQVNSEDVEVNPEDLFINAQPYPDVGIPALQAQGSMPTDEDFRRLREQVATLQGDTKVKFNMPREVLNTSSVPLDFGNTMSESISPSGSVSWQKAPSTSNVSYETTYGLGTNTKKQLRNTPSMQNIPAVASGALEKQPTCAGFWAQIEAEGINPVGIRLLSVDLRPVEKPSVPVLAYRFFDNDDDSWNDVRHIERGVGIIYLFLWETPY